MYKNFSEFKVLNIVWGLWGGVGKYAALISQLTNCSNINIKSLVINCSKWSCHRNIVEKNRLKEIIIKSKLDTSWLKACISEIENFRPNLLFVHSFNGPIIAMLIRRKLGFKLPFVCSFHGEYYAPTPMKTLLSPAYNRLSPFLYNSKSLSVVTVSEYSKQYLLKHSVSENIINVIYNGIPLESSVSQKKSTIRQNWGFSKNEIIIGAVSRLEPIKGIKFLIQAFSSFSKTNTNARLVIAGDGPQKKELEDTATSLGIKEKVKFLGLVRDVDNYLNAIDIYILPSLHENHSLALLEAMRVGKAIVATSVGGNTESVRHESEALIIPPKDTDALTKTLIRLSKDQTLASNLSFAAKQRFESHFTLENMLNKTATWLQQCCHLAKDVNIVRISN